MMLGLWNSCAP